jgi:hypothetical protein
LTSYSAPRAAVTRKGERSSSVPRAGAGGRRRRRLASAWRSARAWLKLSGGGVLLHLGSEERLLGLAPLTAAHRVEREQRLVRSAGRRVPEFNSSNRARTVSLLTAMSRGWTACGFPESYQFVRPGHGNHPGKVRGGGGPHTSGLNRRGLDLGRACWNRLLRASVRQDRSSFGCRPRSLPREHYRPPSSPPAVSHAYDRSGSAIAFGCYVGSRGGRSRLGGAENAGQQPASKSRIADRTSAGRSGQAATSRARSGSSEPDSVALVGGAEVLVPARPVDGIRQSAIVEGSVRNASVEMSKASAWAIMLLQAGSYLYPPLHLDVVADDGPGRHPLDAIGVECGSPVAVTAGDDAGRPSAGGRMQGNQCRIKSRDGAKRDNAPGGPTMGRPTKRTDELQQQLLGVICRAAACGDEQAAAWLRGEGYIRIDSGGGPFCRFDETDRSSPEALTSEGGALWPG